MHEVWADAAPDLTETELRCTWTPTPVNIPHTRTISLRLAPRQTGMTDSLVPWTGTIDSLDPQIGMIDILVHQSGKTGSGGEGNSSGHDTTEVVVVTSKCTSTGDIRVMVDMVVVDTPPAGWVQYKYLVWYVAHEMSLSLNVCMHGCQWPAVVTLIMSTQLYVTVLTLLLVSISLDLQINHLCDCQTNKTFTCLLKPTLTVINLFPPMSNLLHYLNISFIFYILMKKYTFMIRNLLRSAEMHFRINDLIY